jgi:hypothetical protein
LRSSSTNSISNIESWQLPSDGHKVIIPPLKGSTIVESTLASNLAEFALDKRALLVPEELQPPRPVEVCWRKQMSSVIVSHNHSS